LFFCIAISLTWSQTVLLNTASNTNANTVTYTVQYATPQNFYRVYIDTQSNKNSFLINGIKAAFLLENGYLYSYAGNSVIWAWNVVAQANFSGGGNTKSWTVSRNLLESKPCSASYRVLGQVGDTPVIVSSAVATQQLVASPSSNCAGQPPTTNKPQAMAVPSYFYPGAPWSTMQSLRSSIGLTVINPNSGPGAYNSLYASTTAATQLAGITVLGYVHTSNGQRPIATVLAEIDTYYGWYHVDGIFLDECWATDCSSYGYYSHIYQHIKSKGGKGLTIMNPGVTIPECYMTCSDIIITAETDAHSYTNYWRAAGYETKYPASRFWHIVHTASAALMPSLVSRIHANHAGWVYVTDQVMPNPYAALPAYLHNELSLL